MDTVANALFAILREASLGYRGHMVLPAVNLEIRAGEFLVIGGPNGGGKSTLLKTLVGLLPPLGGTLTRQSGQIGYVPQQMAVDAPLRLSVMEVIELGVAAVRPHGISFGRALRERYRACLEACHAVELQNRVFGELSGGQRQRVLMARALALDPEVLLLDEPTAGIDRATQYMIAEVLRELNQQRNLTILLVTHDRRPFESHASRLLRVEDGVIIEETRGHGP